MEKTGKSVKKVRQYGNTLWVPLPSDYVKTHDIKKADLVEVYFDDMLHLKPIDQKALNKKLEDAKKLFEEKNDAKR